MSTWDDFKKTLGKLADKTAAKTRELTDTASLKIKIANKEADRDLEYKRLGKLTYAKLKASSDKDTAEIVAQISKSIENLDNIISELKALHSRDEERKANNETVKKASSNSDDDTLNTDAINPQSEPDSSESDAD